MISQTIMTDHIHEILITDCPICIKQTELIVLPCHHKICAECKVNINYNRDGNKRCPFCRKAYDYTNIAAKTQNNIIVIVDEEDDNDQRNTLAVCVCSSIGLVCCLLGLHIV